MSKKLIIVMTALAFIFVGIVLCVFALFEMDHDFDLLNSTELTTKEFVINEDFSSLNVKSAEGNIRILPSEDGTCRVVCTDDKRVFHNVEVIGDTIYITRTDTRKWYEHIGIFWGSMEVTLYLPKAQYVSAYFKSVSGSVVLESDIVFDELSLQSTSGDIIFRGKVTDALFVKTTSGDIKLYDISAASATVKSVSGDIGIDGMQTTAGTNLNTTSGDIDFERLDAAPLEMRSVSGDVEGSVLSPKNYTVTTTSGTVRVPNSDYTAPECSVKTTSGDIKITQNTF